MPLSESYNAVVDRIKSFGSVWVQCPKTEKWYHTYDKEIVRSRLKELNELVKFHQELELERMKEEITK